MSGSMAPSYLEEQKYEPTPPAYRVVAPLRFCRKKAGYRVFVTL